MTAAAPRTESRTPDLRWPGLVIGAMALAVALIVTVAVVRQAGAPAATTSGQGHDLVVNGTNGGGINYKGIPYPAPDTVGTDTGHIRFNGVPYQAVRRSLTVNGTHGGGIRYTGIPYPAAAPVVGEMPGVRGGALGMRLPR